MSCKHKMIETKCSTCGIEDRFCKNLCGEGSGHAHATPYQDKAGLLRQLDHQSNKQLIAQLRDEVEGSARFEPAGWNGLCEESNAGYHLDRSEVLALLDKIEKELG